MKWTARSVLEMAAIAAMTGVVFVLALLQYRWTGAISRDQQARLQASLKTSVRNFEQEFGYDFERMCEALEVDPEAPLATLEAREGRQFAAWSKTATRPGLVKRVYLWRVNEAGEGPLQTLDEGRTRFRETAWPEPFAGLQKTLRRQMAQLPPVIDDREAIYYPWTVYEDVPALVRPLFQIDSPQDENDLGAGVEGYQIIELDRDYLEKQYLPGLLDRYFGTGGARTFEVAVRSASKPYHVLMVSGPNFPISSSETDANVNLFGLVADEARRRGRATLEPSEEGRQWLLLVRDPAGSLESGVSQWRRRNLGISFGLLAVLAISAVLMFSVARRAERLARTQMEFVAGVSHELCTPLAVINSAAENLADGVVEDSGQIREYGGMIREQGQRLERLVNGVLSLAAGKFERGGYELRAVALGPIVAEGLRACEPMLRDAGFTVEKELAADLPAVMADASVVGTCLENLVSNAMKYAGAERWIAVHARRAAGAAEVELSVEDRGIGIAAEDLPHVFEPFFRVAAVREGQIRGVGLGLYLVKQMMEGMGGRVSVTSQAGRGSSFTLIFPAATKETQPQGEAARPMGARTLAS